MLWWFLCMKTKVPNRCQGWAPGWNAHPIHLALPTPLWIPIGDTGGTTGTGGTWVPLPATRVTLPMRDAPAS